MLACRRSRSKAGFEARTTSKANWSGFLPDTRHALAAESRVQPSASISRKVRQIDDVVDKEPSDLHQLRHRCRERRFSCRLVPAVKRCKRIRASPHEGSREAATSACFRGAHSCKSRRSGFGRDYFTHLLRLPLLRASLITVVGFVLGAVMVAFMLHRNSSQFTRVQLRRSRRVDFGACHA